jgi:hypothetical protein
MELINIMDGSAGFLVVGQLESLHPLLHAEFLGSPKQGQV